LALMASDYSGPVNIGNPQEWTVKQFAEYIQSRILGEADKDAAPIVYKEASKDDPRKRRPDITKAQKLLGWAPAMDVKEGLDQTIAFFRAELGLTTAQDIVPVIWVRPPRRGSLPAAPTHTSRRWRRR
jgi:UDP-glucuronate decarboxylase